MKTLFSLVFLTTILSACGGGGSDSGEIIAIESPSIRLQSGSIARTVVSGTSVAIDVAIQSMNFAFTDNLNATTADSEGVFMPSVSVTDLGNSRYTLSLSSSTMVKPGRYVGALVLNLCSDLKCTVRQQVPSITVPFDINVMSQASVWPGDNLTILNAWPGTADWQTFQGNASHSGYVPVDVDPDNIRTRWSKRFAIATGGHYERLGTLTTENGQFFAASDNAVFARREFDGSQVWKYDLGMSQTQLQV
jgi:outer membrane protein assembly factor BamB